MNHYETKLQLLGLRAIAETPAEHLPEWLRGAEQAVSFLDSNAHSSAVLIYASLGHAFVHGILAPNANISPPDMADLRSAWWEPSDSWCVQRSWSGDEGHRVYLEPPLARPGCNSLVGSEKLIFRRSPEGLSGYEPVIEINQKLVHCLRAYWMPERKSYSRLNEDGDIEDAITIFDKKSDINGENEVAVFIDSQMLAEYMALSNMSLVRKFDFTRIIYSTFTGWDNVEGFEKSNEGIVYRGGTQEGSSFVNGCHISRTDINTEILIEKWRASESPISRNFESFKIYDWKNSKLIEINAGPENLANYFMRDSELPFETSPAFFRPDVLARYKADPDKYEISNRSISCRNAWYLKSYDINEAGQIHCYICDLSKLPFSEQQYWKLFNEWPKAGISERAFASDFESKWSDPDPLEKVIHISDTLDRTSPSWWNKRGEDLRKALHYPVSSSYKEWTDEIIALDQLIVEGFNSNYLRILAMQIGANLEPAWQSLRIIESILEAAGRSTEDAARVVAPLRTLHHLRSKTKGHATSEGRRLEKEALAESGTHFEHYKRLSEACADALASITATLDELSAITVSKER